MKTKTMKRFFSLLLGMTMTASLLTGCGGGNNAQTSDNGNQGTEQGDEGSEKTDKTVTLTLGIWPEDTLTEDIEMHKGFVEEMGKLHPEVDCVPAYYKYSTDTFMPMVESGNCPTIFESWYTEPQKLIKAGAVADITDYLEERGWTDMNPTVKDLLSDENGRIYGIPRDGYALGLMMNVELFEEAGLVDEDGYPIYPKTWDELAETCKTIKDKTGSAGLCLLAKDNSGGWHFSNIAWAFGANLVTDNGDGTYTSNLNSPEAIAAMEYVKSLKWDYKVLTDDPMSEDWGTGFTKLGTGAAAMYIAANDAVNQPTQVNGLPVDKLAMCPIPAGDGGQYSLYGGTPYMFSKDATPEQINAALDYLEIMGKAPVVSDASVAGMKSDAQNRVDNGVPVIKSLTAWDVPEFVEANQQVVDEYTNVDPKMFQSYFDATEVEGNLRAEEPGLTQDMYAELTKVLQAVITDENADVTELMNTANENYQALLDGTYN